MKNARLMIVPVAAMVVAFVWASMGAGTQAQFTPYPLPTEGVATYNWQQDAGQIFGVLPTQVEKVMTAQEYGTHQSRMWVMQGEEREQYQQAIREQILKQARG
jgi:hypothetical protein